MKMKKLFALVLTVCMVITLLAGCSGEGNKNGSEDVGDVPQNTPSSGDGGSGDPTATPTSGGDFVRGCAQVIGEFFTPYKQGNLVEYGWPCYETLALKDTNDEWYPVLADSWEVDGDNYTLTVKLKEGITFHNGDPFDAEDVAFTLNARTEYGTASTIGSPVSVEVVDPYTVKVTWDYFSLNYETWILSEYIFSKETFEEKGLDWMLNNMVGTGPYMMSDYVPDVHLIFVRNPNYWQDKQPGPDTMTWLYMPEETTQVAAYMNGEIDNFLPITATTVKQLQDAGYEGIVANPATSGQTFATPISVNPNDPLSNVDVRRAIFLYGVDWENMALVMGDVLGYHTDCIGLPQMAYYKEDLEQSSFDLEKAKSMLADAGYPDGFSTTIICGSNSTAAATVLQDSLGKLGITAEVEPVDQTLINSDYMSAKATDSGIVISGLFYTANNQTDRFIKHANPTATFGGSSAWTDEIRELWDKVVSAKTQEEQNQYLYEYVDRYVHTDCFMWPMYNTVNMEFVQPWCHFDSTLNSRDPFKITLDPH